GSDARFYYPDGVAVDAVGNLYVADGANDTIRRGGLAIQVSATPTIGSVPLSVQFTASSIDSAGNAITSWNWSFGDGVTSASQNPLHVYAQSGRFRPSLVATNSLGGVVSGVVPTITVAAWLGLVLNGGFETGDFFGWTLDADAGLYNLV